MKANLLKLLSVVAFLSLIVISCDENILDLPNNEVDPRSAQDNSAAELNVSRVFENVNSYGISEEGKKSAFTGEIGVEWNTEHTILTLDYSQVQGASGAITVEFSQAYPTYSMDGLTATITFNNYSNNGIAVAGLLNLTMVHGIGGDNPPQFSINVPTDTWLTLTEGTKVSKWNGTRTFTWSAGYTTLSNNADDEYLIGGTTNGINQNNRPYTVEITTPLKYVVACQYGITEGVMTLIDNPGNDQVSLTCNYGAGASDAEFGLCDSWMLLTVHSGSLTYTARIHF